MADLLALRPSDRQLLAVLSQHGELGRGQLAQLSGLPRSTIADAVARLQRHGLILERDAAARRAAGGAGARTGRPPRLLTLAPPAGLVAVLALTHETLQAAVAGFDGALHAVVPARAHDEDGRFASAGQAVALLDQALAAAGRARADLSCAVIGLPMAVAVPGSPPDSAGDAAFRPPWLPARLPEEAGQQLGIPAWGENDANLGALGEGAFGAATGMPSFIYVKIAQGIGAGLVLDRRLHRGAGGLAGELAHLHTEDDGALCRCGGRGCLMTTLNAIRLIDRIHSVHPAAMSMADVLSLAAAGDAGVCRLLRDLGRTLGRSLADLCVYLAPDGIVLDGLLGSASAPVIEGISESLRQFAPPAIVARVRVVAGQLDSRAELLGAVVLARRRHLRQDILQ
ncbi:MAG TPA: ROK family transcriptional regulator [Streptosporangiaceae bacterium]|jgi:predicted NBD/HSP70 family sugar kinase